jgi:hypothetical protein
VESGNIKSVSSPVEACANLSISQARVSSPFSQECPSRPPPTFTNSFRKSSRRIALGGPHVSLIPPRSEKCCGSEVEGSFG